MCHCSSASALVVCCVYAGVSSGIEKLDFSAKGDVTLNADLSAKIAYRQQGAGAVGLMRKYPVFGVSFDIAGIALECGILMSLDALVSPVCTSASLSRFIGLCGGVLMCSTTTI